MSISSERVKVWRKKTKENIVESLGGKCCICGYNKCLNSLHFHHLVPTEKEFQLGQARGNPISWDKIIKEVKKCALLCSNCHGELHAGLTKIPENIPKFNTKFDIVPKNFGNCPVCDTQKKSSSIYCSRACSGKATPFKKVNWDKVDLKKFLDLGLSKTAIGDMFGVTGGSVTKRARKIGLL